MQNRNLLVFLVVTLVLLIGWMQVRQRFSPPPAPPDPAEAAKDDAAKKKDKEKPKDKPAEAPGDFRLPKGAPVTPDDQLLTMGEADRQSRFHLRVLLDPRGAGVRSVVLNKFQEADFN